MKLHKNLSYAMRKANLTLRVYLEEPIRLPSPHQISFSAHSSVCPFICLSIIYENRLIFHVGIKIRVSTWSFLSIVHPLRIPILMYEKKVRVQQENLRWLTLGILK
jgi:hypothetical protein